MMPTPWRRSSRTTSEQLLDFAFAERGGRLVHDHDARLGAEAPGDLDQLLLRASSDR